MDRWLGRVVDVLMPFPLFAAAMALVAALGNSLGNVVLVTAIINLPLYIRIARSEIAAKRGLPYVMAARLGGLSQFGVITRVLLSNIPPTLAAQISVNASWAALNAALSFIGLGVRPPHPEWGVLVAEGAQYLITGQWWVWLQPAALQGAAVFSFSLAGDSARDLLDPGAARERNTACARSPFGQRRRGRSCAVGARWRLVLAGRRKRLGQVAGRAQSDAAAAAGRPRHRRCRASGSRSCMPARSSKPLP